jgi:anti-sigma regulatory factor (Ser/Thr protein kinase)
MALQLALGDRRQTAIPQSRSHTKNNKGTGLLQKIFRASREPLHVALPLIFTRDSLYFVIDKLHQGLTEGRRKAVLDFKSLERIQVGGITVLSNMIELYRKAGIKTEFVNTSSCKAAPFLLGSGFSAIYLGTERPTVGKNEFLALKLVEYDRSHSFVHQDLVPWLASRLGQDVRALASLRVCFEEIFNNIKDHSTVNVGCSCAHFDEAESKITICISDFGVGIPYNVRGTMQISSDQGAIGMACQEGFTTRSTPRNMGAGLHVLIRNVVTRNSGSVIIYSGKGIYSCTVGPNGVAAKGTGKAAPRGGHYPGTMIYVTLDTKRFVPSAIEEEKFVWD